MVRALVAKILRYAGRRRMDERLKKIDKAKLSKEIRKIDRLESRLERVTDKIVRETEELEGIKGAVRKKNQFSLFGGELTVLILQDIVGAAFGAVFFVITQEIWELSARLAMANLAAISIVSFLIGFSLIYISRRRKMLSIRLFHTSFRRAIEIYIISVLTSVLLILLFSTAPNPEMLLRQTIVVTLPAVITAATADLLFY